MSEKVTRIRTTSADLREVYGRVIFLRQELRSCEARLQRLQNDVEDLIFERKRSGAGRRRTEIYRNVETRKWRIRFELYPEHTEPASGWFGGRILFDHDQDTAEEAVAIARAWEEDGVLPDEPH